MGSTYQMEPQCSENRFPTDFELKEIKQMLLTGDRNEILQSVEKIKAFLNSDESLSEILRADISEFLCDAVLPLDPVIVCTLYSCIEMMAKHVEFFSHNHSYFATESLIRSLHFIVKDPRNVTSLNQCLSLLNIIMEGYVAHRVPPERQTTENLLQLLPTLLTNLPPTVMNKYQTGALIHSFTKFGVLKWSREVSESTLSSFSSWFRLLAQVLECEHPMRGKLILLCSSLCCSVLRFLDSNENSLEKSNFEIDSNLKDEITENAVGFLASVALPYFDSAPFNEIENDPSGAENFFQAILSFYSGDITETTTRLTNGLSEMGFLQYTTKIISFADFRHGQKLRRLSTLALFNVVLYLSEVVFQFPDVWERGRDDFRRAVHRGVSELPVDATQWLDLLVDPHTSSSCVLALFLYLYFYSLTAKSQDMSQAIYPSVVAFIRLTEGIESSTLLLKVVWFVFVISQLCHSSPPMSGIEATNTMVSLLEAQADLSLVYTHHPALLYWAFSTEVSRRIQTQTVHKQKDVHLWLRNKTPDCRELDEVVKKSPEARFAVLDILENGWGEELNAVFSVLKSLLVQSDDEELACGVWFLLPQILAKYTADSTSVTTVDYVIELCSMRTPPGMEPSRVIRVASLLPEVLLKSDLISVVPSLSLVLQLMHLGLQREDRRVFHAFLNHDEFVLKILKGLNSSVADVATISTQIVILLWTHCKRINLEKVKKIEIRKETILNLLEADSEQALSVGCLFLREILLTDFQSPIFQIKDIDENFVEILFIQIQNVCVKSASVVSRLCWGCIKLFLQYNTAKHDFVTHPLLPELVLFFLPRLEESEEFKEFLSIWMDLYNAKFGGSCLGRKIFGGLHAETIRRVGRKLAHDYSLLEKTSGTGKFHEKWNLF